MKKFSLLISVIILTAACLQYPVLAGSGFEPVINGMINDTVNGSMSKGQVDKISNTMSKAADVYYSAPNELKAGSRRRKVSTSGNDSETWPG